MRYVYLLLSVFFFSCSNTIYIVRHAEKAPVEAGASSMQASDPPLSAAGELRAIELRKTLRHQHIDRIFSTNYKRTISTVQPLNELRGNTKIELYNSKKDSMDVFIALLKSIRKNNVLVVGHSNTIDDIANKLCGSTVVPGDLKETQYDNLFVVKRKGNTYQFTGKKYGAPTD